ncbi:hypothetical protein, partial [Nocardia tenerifensis]|uniref:hypothetical protein n=1 Tax=Nocardia tenerifensis TaxID=228006 RepID=UPI001C3F233C
KVPRPHAAAKLLAVQGAGSVLPGSATQARRLRAVKVPQLAGGVVEAQVLPGTASNVSAYPSTATKTRV